MCKPIKEGKIYLLHLETCIEIGERCVVACISWPKYKLKLVMLSVKCIAGNLQLGVIKWCRIVWMK